MQRPTSVTRATSACSASATSPTGPTSPTVTPLVERRTKTCRRASQGAIAALVVLSIMTTHSATYLFSMGQSRGKRTPKASQEHSNRLNPVAFREGIENGVLSIKDPSFFRALQDEIDAFNDTERCARYGWTYSKSHDAFSSERNTNTTQRRIFFGALIAGEPWELIEIHAAESYGLYAGIVLVEGNRTQTLAARKFRQLHFAPYIAQLFGLPESQVLILPHVDEDIDLEAEYTENYGLGRERKQRSLISHGWQRLGMQRDDIGLSADMDECLTRDAARALQRCEGIAPFDYTTHRCSDASVIAMTAGRIYEMSPECVVQPPHFSWQPGIVQGHCIEGIGDETKHPVVSRSSITGTRESATPTFRVDEANGVTYHALWNAADFRAVIGGQRFFNTAPGYEHYTSYHFHNFMAHLNHMRFKYQTYGHANAQAHRLPMQHLTGEFHLVLSCVMNTSYPPDHPSHYYHEPGGFVESRPFLPIYFYDNDYRRRRQAHVAQMIQWDEAYLAALLVNESVPIAVQ